MDYFKYFGRDMETLLAKVKIAHGRRVFCKKKTIKKQITKKDMDNGFKLYLNNNEVKSRKKENYFLICMFDVFNIYDNLYILK